MTHPNPHPTAGQTVTIRIDGQHHQYRLEDWWDRVAGKSWMVCDGNPACMNYAIRTGLSGRRIPTDDEVVYGKIGLFGHLVHVSEIVETTTETPAYLTEAAADA